MDINININSNYPGLDVITSLLRQLVKQGASEMRTAQELLAAATAQTSVVNSVVAAIKALRDEVKALPGIPPDVQAAIEETFNKVTADTAALTEAITTNTPVPPEVIEETPL